MHRLIIETVGPLNAQFCEALVAVVGECEVIPLTENYCAVEGFKMDCAENGFLHLLAFIQVYAGRAFLGWVEKDIDIQIDYLGRCPKTALLSELAPPQFMFDSYQLHNDKLFVIKELEFPQ